MCDVAGNKMRHILTKLGIAGGESSSDLYCSMKWGAANRRLDEVYAEIKRLEQELEAAKAEIKSNISELKKTYELISYWADDSRNKELEIKALRSQPTPREVINSALGYLDSCLYGDEGFNEIVAALKYHRDNRLGDNIETLDK